MTNAETLINRLISIRSLNAAIVNLQREISMLEEKMSEYPHKSFDYFITQVRDSHKQIQEDYKKSTIHSTHDISDSIFKLVSKVMDLTATEARAATLDVSTHSSSSTLGQIKLPKLSFPSFRGDPMKWSVFWEQFSSAVHNNDQLDNTQKLTYLREAIVDPTVTPLLFRATATASQYDEPVKLLKDRYDQKHLIHCTHAMAIIDAPVLKQG